jgi:hypothetical protein
MDNAQELNSFSNTLVLECRFKPCMRNEVIIRYFKVEVDKINIGLYRINRNYIINTFLTRKMTINGPSENKFCAR